MIEPLRMIATRLQSSSTSYSRWLERRIVIPSPASRRTRSRMSRMPAGSRPVAGSSSKRRRGDPETLTHAMRVAADLVLRAVSQLHRLEHRLDPGAGARLVVIGEQPKVAAAGEVRIEPRPLDEPGHALERPRTFNHRVAAE